MSSPQIPRWLGFPAAVIIGLGAWATATGHLGAILETRKQQDLVSRRQEIVADFTGLYLRSAGHWDSTKWLGVGVWKNPMDLWTYQEIIYETKPDVIIEAGTWHGGSAFYMAKICDLIGRGKIISIDIEAYPQRPEHPRIQYLLGSSISGEIVRQVKDAISPGDRVMVTLDSDHSTQHVLNELRTYAPLVSEGNYLIVDDTSAGEDYHPAHTLLGGGPMAAVETFLKDSPEFRADRSREKFVMTYNPKGYLLKTVSQSKSN